MEGLSLEQARLDVDPNHDPIFSNLRVKLLGACAAAMNAMESLCVMLLLNYTPLQCNFIPYYQMAIVPAQIATTFVVSWASGLLTDHTAPFAHRVLQCLCLICALVDAFMFLFDTREGLILFFFIVRFSGIVQFSNSIGKVLKLHLTALQIPEQEQIPIFNNVTILGDSLGRFFTAVVAFTLPVVLIDHAPGLIDFDQIKYIGFSTIFFVDCMAFTISLFIQRDYIYTDEELPPQPEEPPVDANVKLEPEDTSQLLEDPDFQSPLEESNFFWYLRNSCIRFFRQRLLWCLTLQIVLLQLANAFVQIVLRFDLAKGPPSSQLPSKQNYCGGLVRNILLQDAVTDAVRIGAAVFYHFALSKLKPSIYFRWLSFIFFGLVFVLAALTYWEGMDPTASSVLLALMIGFFYILMTYANSTISAIVPSNIYGFTFAVQLSVTILTGLIPVGLSSLELDGWANTTALLVELGFTILFSIGLLAFNQAKILEL